MNWHVPFDMNLNQIKEVLFDLVTAGTEPSSPTAGQFWFRTDASSAAAPFLRIGYFDGTVKAYVPRVDKTESITGDWTFSRGASTPPFFCAATLPSVGSTATMVTNLNANYLQGYLADAGATANTIGLRDSNGRLSVADPTTALHAVNLQYLQSYVAGVRDPKDACRVATTANVNLATGGALTIDGVATAVGDRVLVKDQSTASENGIYVVASGAWTRASDADVSAEVTNGLQVWVTAGTDHGGTGWLLNTADPITLGSTSLTFIQVNGTADITAGNGLVKVGNTLHALQSGAYTQWGVVYAPTTSTLGLSAAGSNNQVLHANTGGAPTWSAVSLTADVSGTLPIANGGSGQTSALAAFNALSPLTTRGDLLTRDASNNVRLGLGAAGKVLRSNGTDALWSTATFADTYAVSTILYASSADTVTGLATTNRAALATNATGVPTWLALTNGQIVIGSTAGAPAAATLTAGAGVSVTNASNSVTIGIDAATMFANPSASIGLTVVNGVATTAMRSDAAPALSQAIGPTWTGVHTWSIASNSTSWTAADNLVKLVTSAAATSNTTHKPSPWITLIANVWDGDSSEARAFQIQNQGISGSSDVWQLAIRSVGASNVDVLTIRSTGRIDVVGDLRWGTTTSLTRILLYDNAGTASYGLGTASDIMYVFGDNGGSVSLGQMNDAQSSVTSRATLDNPSSVFKLENSTGFRLNYGYTPGLVDGDLWMLSTGVYARIAGATVQIGSTTSGIFAGTSSGTAGTLPKFESATTLVNSMLSESSSMLTAAGRLTLTGGATITTDIKLFDSAITWNAAGVAFTGWKLNVTSTASHANSLLLDLQVGGTSMFKLDKAGVILNGTWNAGVVGLTYGGTGKALTAVAGGVVWTDSDSMEVSAAGTTGQLLRSTGTTAPGWTTAVFASTYAASTLLYSNGANNVAGLATANSAVLLTNATGVPAWSSTMTNGQVIIGSTGGTPVAAALTGTGNQITVTPGAGSITLSTPQDIHSAATPQFARLGIGVAAGATTELTVLQPVRTSGSPTMALFTAGAHTTLAASTEAIDINFNLARTVQFAAGALTTQRAFVIQAPTYGFVSASTLTTAATLVITGAPIAGTNATITEAYGLWIQNTSVSTATRVKGLVIDSKSSGGTQGWGAWITHEYSGAGSSTFLVGLRAGVINSAASGSLTGYGLWAASPSVTAGAITTAYGLYIAPQKVSGVTTGVGLYQADAGDINWIVGKTFFGGTTTPTAWAHFAACSTTVAPILFTPSGASVLTTRVAGAMEVDASGFLYFTHNTTFGTATDRRQVATTYAMDITTGQDGIGTIGATSVTITHNRGTKDVQVSIYALNANNGNTTGDKVGFDVRVSTTNAVIVSYGNGQLVSGDYRIIVTG